MKKLLFVLGLFPLLSSAETTKSFLLANIPSQCDARIILQEVPMVFNDSAFLMGEVLDVRNVRTVSKTSNQLVCYADLITQEQGLNRTYQITFSANSLGDVLVSYR